nr:MAG TPA: hypothetical protein [Caudoviricetes sp.]
MGVKTRLFSSEYLEDALTDMEEFCDDQEVDPEDVIQVCVVSKGADKDSSVVLVYDDCVDHD